MDKHIIAGVHITERVKHAAEVQKVFTDFGCQIRTRLGLHEADKGLCSPNGLILLDLAPHDQEWVRSEWADQWLGFDERELRGWLTGAGLKLEVLQTLEGPEPAFSVMMIVATKEDKKRSK